MRAKHLLATAPTLWTVSGWGQYVHRVRAVANAYLKYSRYLGIAATLSNTCATNKLVYQTGPTTAQCSRTMRLEPQDSAGI